RSWEAMQLMGRYAEANHELIHQHIVQNLGTSVLSCVENHHNFAWKINLDGEELIIHRKGATPAEAGIEGIIPGSMGSCAYVVRGKGNPESLYSCSHGAGRLMSRGTAFKTLQREEVIKYLNDKGVEVISGLIDEAPMVYKDIDVVMSYQNTLVEVLAKFYPRMVMMAPPEKGHKNDSISTW
ncbi:MAG: RtcB family protein, partial [Desulfovibrionaceae bacterium]|nr:RtcB family protein [Desulfovibrionaceae bacterium]